MRDRVKVLYIPLFQFTPLRGGRHTLLAHVVGAGKFQFTPLREGRPCTTNGIAPSALFQFTPLREGRQATSILKNMLLCISIHAPA